MSSPVSSPASQTLRADDPAEQLSHERILVQALSLFASEGYGAMTVRAIARAAGLTIGTLYHYFPSKRALYLAVLDRAYGRAAKHWAQEVLHGPNDPYERLDLRVPSRRVAPPKPAIRRCSLLVWDHQTS